MLLSNTKPTITYSLLELKASFLVLLKKQNIENKIQHEEQKLHILHAIKIKLQQELPGNYFSSRRMIGGVAEKHVVMSLLYWFLIIIGLLQEAVGSYLFAQTLFSVIPGLSAIFLSFICTIYVVLDAIIFYAFNVSFLKDALNLPRCSNNLGYLLKIYNEQLLVTTELNQNLLQLSVLKMDRDRYEYYVGLVVLMNQDLRSKHQEIQGYSHSSFNNILKYGVIGFGLLSNIASYYYLGIAFSAFIAPVVGAFLASTMVFLTIISGLSFYYAIGLTSIMCLVDPNKEDFDALKIKLMAFSENYKNDLADAIDIKNEINLHKRHIDTSSQFGLKVFDKKTHESTNEARYDETMSENPYGRTRFYSI